MLTRAALHAADGTFSILLYMNSLWNIVSGWPFGLSMCAVNRVGPFSVPQLGKVHPALKDGHVGGSFQRHQIRIFSFRV